MQMIKKVMSCLNSRVCSSQILKGPNILTNVPKMDL